MSRLALATALAAAVTLAACNSAESGGTTAPSTESAPTTTDAVAATVSSVADPETTTAASVTTAGQPGDEVPAGLSDVPQFGFQFVLPAPLTETPPGEHVFRAASDDPKGLFTVAECSNCRLDVPASPGERQTSLEIDGVPVLIVENVDFDLGEEVSSNGLIVADGERKFSAFMSFEGDIEPLWDAFIDSVRFVDPDPSAVAAAGPTETVAAPAGPLTIEDAGLTFSFPDGFDSDFVTLKDGGYSATRASDGAIVIVFLCPDCTRSGMAEPFEDIEIDGYPAVLAVRTDPDGTTTRFALISAEGGQNVFASATGADTEEAFQQLLDSIDIAQN